MNCEIGSSPSCPSQPNDCLLSPPPLPPPTDVEHGIVEPKLEHEATDFSNHETSVTRDDSGLSQSNIQDVPSSPNQTGNKNENCEEENDESALCVICLETIDPSQRASGLCRHSFHHDCLMEWTTKKHNDCPTCRQPLAAVDPSRSQAIEHVVSHVRIVIPNPRDVYAPTREPDRGWERCNQFVFTCCGIAVVGLMVYFLIS